MDGTCARRGAARSRGLGGGGGPRPARSTAAVPDDGGCAAGGVSRSGMAENSQGHRGFVPSSGRTSRYAGKARVGKKAERGGRPVAEAHVAPAGCRREGTPRRCGGGARQF